MTPTFTPLACFALLFSGAAAGALAVLAYQRVDRRVKDMGLWGSVVADPRHDSSETAISNALSIVAPSDKCLTLDGKPKGKASKGKTLNHITNTATPADTAYSRTAKDQRMKLILVVRTDLGMSKGKMCAQCCHAAVGVYSSIEKTHPELLESWLQNGQAKIAVRINSEAELLNIVDVAEQMGLPSFIVQDAGHTQCAPGSLTVAAIGPGESSFMDKVTGHLKLLG